MSNNSGNLSNLPADLNLKNSVEQLIDVLKGQMSLGPQPEIPVTESWVSENYGIPMRTLSDYRKKGLIRFHKLGNRTYIFRSELNEDIKRNSLVFND